MGNNKLAAPADLEALKALALAAGGRQWVDNGTRIQELRESGEAPSDKQLVWHYDFEGDAKPEHRAFVAGANPAVVLALIDRIAALEAETAATNTTGLDLSGCWERAAQKWEAAAQKAVAELTEVRALLATKPAALEALRVGQQAVPASVETLRKYWVDGSWNEASAESGGHEISDALTAIIWGTTSTPALPDLSKLTRYGEVAEADGGGEYVVKMDRGEFYKVADVQALLAAAPAPAPALLQEKAAPAEQPSKITDTKSARRFVCDWHMKHFPTDRTFTRYVMGEDSVRALAGDFAWQLANALALAQAAPQAAQQDDISRRATGLYMRHEDVDSTEQTIIVSRGAWGKFCVPVSASLPDVAMPELRTALRELRKAVSYRAACVIHGDEDKVTFATEKLWEAHEKAGDALAAQPAEGAEGSAQVICGGTGCLDLSCLACGGSGDAAVVRAAAPAEPSDDDIKAVAINYAHFVAADTYDVTKYDCAEDFFNCVRACIKKFAAEGATQAGDARDCLSTILWMYRRLPHAYGCLPSVEKCIKALGAQTGQDVAEDLRERQMRVGVSMHEAAQEMARIDGTTQGAQGDGNG